MIDSDPTERRLIYGAWNGEYGSLSGARLGDRDSRFGRLELGADEADQGSRERAIRTTRASPAFIISPNKQYQENVGGINTSSPSLILKARPNTHRAVQADKRDEGVVNKVRRFVEKVTHRKEKEREIARLREAFQHLDDADATFDSTVSGIKRNH